VFTVDLWYNIISFSTLDESKREGNLYQNWLFFSFSMIKMLYGILLIKFF